MQSTKRKRVLILQGCQIDHLVKAARAVLTQYPRAKMTGWVYENDLGAVKKAGVFFDIVTLPAGIPASVRQLTGEEKFNLCVLAYESRLGVKLWPLRLIAFRSRASRIASFSRTGRLREWSRWGWLGVSTVICFGIGPVHRRLLWLWNYGRRWADVAALFLLAAAANVLAFGRWLAGSFIPGPSQLEGERIRVVLFIPSMGMGGAQRQVVTLLEHVDRSRFDVELVMLDTSDKFFEPAVRNLGIPITYLNDHWDFWRSAVVLRLARHLRRRRVAVLHSWLHYAVNLGAIAGAFTGVPVMIGSLRSQKPGRFPWFYPPWQRAMDVLTTPLLTRVVANSDAVREECGRWALVPERKLATIRNGIDVGSRPTSNESLRMKLREEFGFSPTTPLIGIIGRLYPEKDHETFLRASVLVQSIRPEVRFLIVGDGSRHAWIEAEIKDRGMVDYVRLLGNRTDVQTLVAGLDVLVLTSLTEGFPNVLLEAAAAGIPAVTTDAGGAAEIVQDGQTGFVVPCGDAEGIAQRVMILLDDPARRRRFGMAARERTESLFCAMDMTRKIEHLYTGTAPEPVKNVNGRKLHVCFVSTNAYGLFQPAAGIPWGGAEVQIKTLAAHLARDPHLTVSLLTGDRGRAGFESHDGVSVHLSPLFKKLQVSNQGDAGSQAGLQIYGGRKGASPASNFWEHIRHVVRAIVERLPFSIARLVRWPVKTYCAVRDLVMDRLSPIVRLQREGRECIQWFRQLSHIRADVYVMRCASPQLAYVRLASWALNRSLVYMVAHEQDVTYVKGQGYWGKRYEWGLRHVDRVICQHQEQVHLLRARFGKEGRLLRSLCPSQPRGHFMEGRRHVLWVARVDGWKRPDLYVRLAQGMPEMNFVMVGPPSQRDPLQQARLLELTLRVSNLQWLGLVPFDKTTALFETAILFVNTSESEGFPNTFLQAAACGTPIVSWMVNPERVLDSHGIGFCADGDWFRFEQVVRRLSADPALRERLGQNGRRWVRAHHDPAVVTQQAVDLFMEVSRGRKRGGATPTTGMGRAVNVKAGDEFQN